VEDNERFLVFNHGEGTKEAELVDRLLERLRQVQEKERARLGIKFEQKKEEEARLHRARELIEQDEIERREKW